MSSFVPEEYPISIHVNGTELGIFQLTKADLHDWAVGYLFGEGIIDSVEEIHRLAIDDTFTSVFIDIESFDESLFRQKKKHFTAGCGRGVTFFSMDDVKKFKKITTKRTASLHELLKWRHEFSTKSPMYAQTGGMHGASIVKPDGTIVVREDIGRHNAVDKVIGHALRSGLHPEELILITTGRVSYEMLSKAARFGIGIIGSRTAATKQAIELAKFLHIEVVGYLRGKRATIYTSQGYVVDDLHDALVNQ